MRSLKRLGKAIRRDCRGATAVEYSFILALIFLAMCGAVAGLGNHTANIWNNISETVANAH